MGNGSVVILSCGLCFLCVWRFDDGVLVMLNKIVVMIKVLFVYVVWGWSGGSSSWMMRIRGREKMLVGWDDCLWLMGKSGGLDWLGCRRC